MPVIFALISISIVTGLAFWLWQKTANDKLLRSVFWPALFLKVLSGILLGFIFSTGCKHGCDTWVFQQTANILTAVFKSDAGSYWNIIFYNEFADKQVLKGIPYPTYTNSFFFTKAVSLLNFITGRNYYLNSIYFSLFSFAGCWFLVLKLRKFFPGSAMAAIIGLLFFPSVVFWNSGLLKDGVLLGSLCFLWGAALELAFRPKERAEIILIFIFISGWLLWKIKFFVAAFVFAITGSWFCLHWLYTRHAFFRQGYLRWVAALVIICLVAFCASLLHYKFNLPFLLTSLVLNYQLFIQKSAGKPVIDLDGLEPTLSSILWHTPEAVFGVLFRPFLWEGDNLFYRVAGLENLLIMVLFLGALAGFRKFKLKQIPGFYLVLLVFCVCLAVAFGLSTPNLGSLSRYRTAFLPFLVFLLLETPFWRRFLIQISAKVKGLRA